MKKNIIYLFLFFIFSQTIILAQIPVIQWQKPLGGSRDDAAYSIVQTKNGGYIVAGYSQSNDGDVTGNHANYLSPEDFWVTKTDACGTLVWEKSLGGTGSDEASCIIQTPDGGYLVTGYTCSTDGDITNYLGGPSDAWLVKLDTAGNIQWQETLGGTGEDGIQCIQHTTDGGYIAIGWSDNGGGDHDFDYWMLKLDSVGNVKWQHLYGGSADDTPYSIQQTPDGGYIGTGYSQSVDFDITNHHGAVNVNDCWVIKTDSLGTLEWQNSFGGTLDDVGQSILLTTDGKYIVAGSTSSTDGDVTGNHGAYDEWIIKFDTNGTLLWEKCYGGTANDQAYAIQKTIDKKYIVAGITYSNNGDVTGFHGGVGDYWVDKIDSLGTLQWQKAMGGSGDEGASAIAQTIDGGYAVAGASTSNDGDVSGAHGNYDFWIVKLLLNNTMITGNTTICNTDSTTLTASGATTYSWSPAGIVSPTVTIAPSSNTTYTVIASTGNCFITTNTITVVVNQLPVVTFTTLGFPDSVCTNAGNQTLTGGFPNGGVYNGTSVTGNIFNPLTAGVGVYTLVYTYTDAHNCTDSATHAVIVKLCFTTETNQSVNSTNQLIIYPNPATGFINIQSETELGLIIIYNSLGEIVSQIKSKNTTEQIDISKLSQGAYIICTPVTKMRLVKE